MEKKLTALGETEMEVLQHVWQLGEASVADVQQRILADRTVAYTTIMTVMKNLYEKDYLDYRKEGNSYIYFPKKKPESVKYNLVSSLIKKVFKGSPAALVQNLVEHEDLSEDDIQKLKSLIDSMKR